MGLRTICDHVIDIAQNAVDSGTNEATLRIDEKREESFHFSVVDRGKGISGESLESVLDPFYTEKRKKVKFGLGLPMLKLAAESTGGEFRIRSVEGYGTEVSAKFLLSSIDCQPVGDVPLTLFAVITMSNCVDWSIERLLDDEGYAFSSSQFREAFGNDCFTSPVKMKMVLTILQEAEISLGGLSDVR
ncbi:MAG: sensor histidine kinase [Kosmotogaceae bacterium]|nr:sensor histidine kinase [Kosmotogaceae bacterium]